MIGRINSENGLWSCYVRNTKWSIHFTNFQISCKSNGASDKAFNISNWFSFGKFSKTIKFFCSILFIKFTQQWKKNSIWTAPSVTRLMFQPTIAINCLRLLLFMSSFIKCKIQHSVNSSIIRFFLVQLHFDLSDEWTRVVYLYYLK